MTIQSIIFICETCKIQTDSSYDEGTIKPTVCQLCINWEKLAFEQYTPPFFYSNGYIFDANNDMVADDPDKMLQVRGFGKLISEYPEETVASIQDAIGIIVAKALTEYWKRNDE